MHRDSEVLWKKDETNFLWNIPSKIFEIGKCQEIEQVEISQMFKLLACFANKAKLS